MGEGGSVHEGADALDRPYHQVPAHRPRPRQQDRGTFPRTRRRGIAAAIRKGNGDHAGRSRGQGYTRRLASACEADQTRLQRTGGPPTRHHPGGPGHGAAVCLRGNPGRPVSRRHPGAAHPGARDRRGTGRCRQSAGHPGVESGVAEGGAGFTGGERL